MFWDESYHNTSIYHISKKNYNTALQLALLSHIQKPVSNFHLCQILQNKSLYANCSLCWGSKQIFHIQ